uniref:Uncharacterized protein n=1 Tax=Arundo donax TaxID=35708 RepID=A0A0A9HED7_ARUDO
MVSFMPVYSCYFSLFFSVLSGSLQIALRLMWFKQQVLYLLALNRSSRLQHICSPYVALNCSLYGPQLL